MFMRAVLASAMLIAVAGAAQAGTKIIYPPYSYQPPMKLCDYVLGGYGGCGYHYGYGHRNYHDDMVAGVVVDESAIAQAQANVVVILPPANGQ